MHVRQLMCAALLLFVTPTVSAEKLADLKGVRRVVFLGDSITYSGQYIETIDAYLALTMPERPIELLNLGLPSETVSGLSEPGHAGGAFPRPDVHERLARVLEKTKPDLVVACYGMNCGMYHPLNDERFKKFQDGMLRLRELADKAGAKVLHVTPPVFDPQPLRGRTLPAGRDEYRQPFEGYNSVLDKFSEWLLAQREKGWQVVDLHGPMNALLAEQRKTKPDYVLAGDGVHMNDVGHWLTAKQLLLHWGLAAEKLSAAPSAAEFLKTIPNGVEVLKLAQERQRVLKDSWLTDVGHKRPGMNRGLPLAEAQQRAAEITKKIAMLTFPKADEKDAKREFKAGAFAQPISPTKFPAPVNGNFKGIFAESIHDHMHARCLALSDGRRELLLCVVDACLIPRDICDRAKELAATKTGVPASHMLIAATHTHSAATLTPAFQSEPDPEYVAALPARIAAGLIQAHANLEPAEIGWGSADDPTQVFNRRWVMKEGETYENPFGETIDRILMNPGYQNPKVAKPAGPVDPEVAVLVVRATADKRPLALLANYSLHYVGGHPAISADYFAAFANEIGERLKTGDDRYRDKAAFVGIMSNGTSGDINNVKFAEPAPPKRLPGEQIKVVAQSVATAALAAYEKIEFRPHVSLDALEVEIPLAVRKANPAQLARAKEVLAAAVKDQDGQYSHRTAIYAIETIALDAYPDSVPVKLQTFRIGDLGIAAVPCEVFVELGLDWKRKTPLAKHFTISLANGYHGYLPTTAQHELGGYETWRARSSYLETAAADKISARLLEMLGKLKDGQ